MTDTDFPHLDETVVATARYLAAVVELDEEQLRAPSLLPGWTRAHVITHVARNADGLRALLQAAETGEERFMYPSVEARNSEIEEGAGRSPAELRADAVASSGRWVQAANEVHAKHLDALVRRMPDVDPVPARGIGLLRRTEVEVHHADLGLGYTAADWPGDLVEALMERRRGELEAGGVALTWTADDTGRTWTTGEGPHVTGTAADLVWWLLGRGDGEHLARSDSSGAAAALPDLGRWI